MQLLRFSSSGSRSGSVRLRVEESRATFCRSEALVVLVLLDDRYMLFSIRSGWASWTLGCKLASWSTGEEARWCQVDGEGEKKGARLAEVGSSE